MKLIIERGKTVSFESLPPKSIALDGYVQGPFVDAENCRFSFDHHDKCVRLVTSATCEQVLDALLMGLDPRDYTVFVNDVDEDTVLSVWLLENPERVLEPKVRRLVEMVAKVDAHGIAYPVLERDLFETFGRIAMAPVAAHRKTKTLHTADQATLLRQCIDGVAAMLGAEVKATERPSRSYQLLFMGLGGWVLVQSDDQVSDLIYADGHTKAILYQPLQNDTYNYTVMKKSDLVMGFPVGPGSQAGTILHRLNELEPGWGGGSTIGGAPRNADGSRSRLSPREVFDVVQNLLKS